MGPLLKTNSPRCVQSMGCRFLKVERHEIVWNYKINLAVHLESNHPKLHTEFNKNVKEAKETKEKEVQLRSPHHSYL